MHVGFHPKKVLVVAAKMEIIHVYLKNAAVTVQIPVSINIVLNGDPMPGMPAVVV